MSRFLRSSLLLILASLVSNLHAEQKLINTFDILDIKGTVLMRVPWELEWKPVQNGRTLVEGTLLNIDGPSTITIEGVSSNLEGLKTDKVRVGLTGPLILRLEPGAIRKINLNAFFFERMPASPQTPEEIAAAASAAAEPQLAPMSRAWQWFTAMLPKNTLMQALSGPQPVTSGGLAQVAIRAKRIKLLTPLDGALTIAETLPVKVKIMWEAIAIKDVKYEVRVWRAGVPRGAPVSVTSLNYYFANIKEDADYFIQVSTVNEPWHSDAHVIHVASTQKSPEKATKAVDELAAPDDAPVVEPTLPPNGFNLFVSSFPIKVYFNWKLESGNSSKMDGFEVVFLDQSGKELSRERTKDYYTSHTFTQGGEYRWRVIGVRYSGAKQERTQEWAGPDQSLIISPPKTLAAILSGIGTLRVDQVIYLGSSL